LTEDSKDAFTVLCLVRDAAGRWLAGRRAEWVATWPGSWALGAGGSVELGESPVETIERELKEEWEIEGVEPTIEALIKHHGFIALIGSLWLPEENVMVTPDHEHDAYQWWPSEIEAWPSEAHPGLKELAKAVFDS
jgi:8-oxo-dGTP pyrophosphatase MutT (NUDIX family)